MNPSLLALLPGMDKLSPEELQLMIDALGKTATNAYSRATGGNYSESLDDPDAGFSSEPLELPQRTRNPTVAPGLEAFDDDQIEAISQAFKRREGPDPEPPTNLDAGIETLHPPFVQARLTDPGVNSSAPIRPPDPAMNEYGPSVPRLQQWVSAADSSPEASISHHLRGWANDGLAPQQIRDPSGYGLIPPQPPGASMQNPRGTPPPMGPSTGPGMLERAPSPMLLPGQQPWAPSPAPAPAPRMGGMGGPARAPAPRPMMGPPKSLRSPQPSQAGMDPWMQQGGRFAMEEHDAASQRGMAPRAPIGSAPSGRDIFSARTERPELQTGDSIEQAKRRERELLLRQRGFGTRGEAIAPNSRDLMQLFNL